MRRESMRDKICVSLANKMVAKALVNELCNKGIIDFISSCNIIKRIDEDISKLEKLQENSKEVENIMIEIPV